jgi:hypothetical protein
MTDDKKRFPTPGELSDLGQLESAAKQMFATSDVTGFRMLFMSQRWAAIDLAHHEVTAGFNRVVFPAIQAMESFLAQHVLQLEVVQEISDSRGAGAVLYKDSRTGARVLVNRDEVYQFGEHVAWVLAWAREREREKMDGKLALTEQAFGAGIVSMAGKEHDNG